MAALRISLTILWNHIMKNFHIVFTFLWSWNPGIYPQVYHRTPRPAVLICKGVLIKNKGGVGLFQISQKKRLFHLLQQPSALGHNLTIWSPFLHPPNKTFLSLSVWSRREYIWKLNWKESLLICFENCQGVPCSHRQSRNRMMNTFIIVNITPICKR